MLHAFFSFTGCLPIDVVHKIVVYSVLSVVMCFVDVYCVCVHFRRYKRPFKKRKQREELVSQP